MRPPGQLWGGILDSVSIDVLQHRISIKLHVEHKSAQSPESHVLIIDEVADFRWFSAIPRPWDYAEITEFHARDDPSGDVVIDIMLWSEDAGITVRAKSAWLDGVQVTERSSL
jgi:hypothetical protein